VELFPYGFFHDMYVDGGGSGLKYFSYTVTTGDEYPDLAKYQSLEACLAKDHDCKVHYRDANLMFTDTDLKGLGEVFVKAFDYLRDLN